MKPIKKIEFTAELVKEYSFTPNLESLGKHKCSMELWTDDGTFKDGTGTIEWLMDIDTDQEDAAANIGVWWVLFLSMFC